MKRRYFCASGGVGARGLEVQDRLAVGGARFCVFRVTGG